MNGLGVDNVRWQVNWASPLFKGLVILSSSSVMKVESRSKTLVGYLTQVLQIKSNFGGLPTSVIHRNPGFISPLPARLLQKSVHDSDLLHWEIIIVM